MSPTKYRKVTHYDNELDAHALTFSCFHRYPLLSKERTCRWLVQAVDTARIKHSFDLWAWVAMPNHAHLLIWPRIKGYSTGKILQSIKTSVGRKAINYLRKHSPQFLERLKVVTGKKVEYISGRMAQDMIVTSMSLLSFTKRYVTFTRTP